MDDIADNQSTAAVILPGSFVDSAIDSDGDVDFVRVQLTAGEFYRFGMAGRSATNGLTLDDPLLRLIGPDMQVVAENDDGPSGLDSQIWFAASFSGTYYLAAAAFSGTGSYRLTMDSQAAVDDYGQTIATAGTLTVDHSISGAIDCSGDNDWFGIRLEAGVTYELLLKGGDSGSGTLADPMLFLYNENGGLIVASDDSADTLDSFLVFTPEASGTYYLGAAGYEDGFGSYEISARRVVNETAASHGTGSLLVGGPDADELGSGAGNDILYGAGGNDDLDGGAGFDTARYDAVFRQADVGRVGGAIFGAASAVDGTDFLTSIEQLQFKDGVFVCDPESLGAQVQRMYDTVLGRAPDAVGLDYWVDRMEDGLGLGAVAQAIASSAEFQQATGGLSNAAFVDYVYGQALGRGADPGGRGYWIGRLDAGLSRGDMLVGFSESAEHRARTADIVERGYFQTDDAAQAVALLYDSFASRLPDVPGLIFWTDQIKTASRTVFQVADAFAASGEFQAATRGKSNGELVDFMYQNTLDRGPDGAGRAYWIDQLDHGFTQGQLLLAFSQSPEHANLMAPHIIGGIDVLM